MRLVIYPSSENPSCSRPGRRQESLQTRLVRLRVWFPPLHSMVLWCLLKMPKALVMPEGCCWEQGCCLGQRWGGQQPTWEPWQLWALLKGFPAQGNSPAYKGPRISVFLACHDRGVRVSGIMVLPSTPCAPFLKSHANVFSELFLSARLRGLGLLPQDVLKLERVSKRFPAAWASLKTQNVTPVFWALRPLREKKCCWRQYGFDDSAILPVSVAQLIFFLFLKVALQPSCETPVVY